MRTSSVGTAFRRLQQANARGHDYTECADDFHALILRLNVASGKYDDPFCAETYRSKQREQSRLRC